MKKKAKHPNKIGVVGRKPIEDALKKRPVTVYLGGAEIEAIGGIDQARNISLLALKERVEGATNQTS